LRILQGSGTEAVKKVQVTKHALEKKQNERGQGLAIKGYWGEYAGGTLKFLKGKKRFRVKSFLPVVGQKRHPREKGKKSINKDTVLPCPGARRVTFCQTKRQASPRGGVG